MRHPTLRPTRRTFLAGAAAIAVSAATRRGSAVTTDKLRIAVVGCGGRGADDIAGVASQQIVALCDCDEQRAAESFKAFPAARRYSDWRRLFDNPNDYDAVVVATPDHNHAIVASGAMNLGKHVYCEKPLAHSIFEVRHLSEVAAAKKVATQMGTQGHAFPGTREAVEVIRSGAIGDVAEVHVWTDRPKGWWPQGVTRPADSPAVPAGLDWDIWLGPAPLRPYHPLYVPFKWRGRWDFGTGAIGDMGIHNFDTAFWALELTAPTSVKIIDAHPAVGSDEMRESAPLWSLMRLQFPARGDKPPVTLHWYDGGKLPPADLFLGEKVPTGDGGSLIVGSKGSLLTRTWHGGQNKSDWYRLLPRGSSRTTSRQHQPSRGPSRITSNGSPPAKVRRRRSQISDTRAY